MENSKFNYTIDSFNCVKLDLRCPENYQIFASVPECEVKLIIDEIIKELLNKSVKAIWLNIPIELSYLIQYFVKEEFNFHHIESNNLLIMSKWLKESPNRLPNYATHYFGVGGLILNQKGELLLVKEKNTFAQLKGMWKIPTGLANKGESIKEALLREIKEETGLDTTFIGVYNFREAYPYLFDCCDIFFICVCSVDISNQKVDIITGDELDEYKWFSTEEIRDLVNNQKVSKNNQYFFSSIIDLLPEKIINKTMKVSKDINFLNSRFIFHNPKL